MAYFSRRNAYGLLVPAATGMAYFSRRNAYGLIVPAASRRLNLAVGFNPRWA